MSSSTESDLPGDDPLQRMYRITSDYNRPFEDKLLDLLDLGREYLGVQAGFLTEVSGDTQVIVGASGDHELLQTGESCPLSKAYCRKTVEVDETLTVQHASLEGWERDAAYEKFGLESYIGSKVIVDGELYGTFCFADREPRDQPFSDDEEVFVELMAEWVSYELFQQRASERIKEQRDRMEEFVGVVSHDLRNPLGIVEGYLDLAQETGDPEHFDRCRDAVDRMGTLIDDLLVLAKEGESIEEPESITLDDVATEAWSYVPTDSATLDVESDFELIGDWSRVQQLFENLFRNAVEHGGEGVTIRVGVLDGGDGIYVEDDGPGIPADQREEIFANEYSTSESDVGFGLTIVEQIVDTHGWEISVTEGSMGGARFEITGVETGVDTDIETGLETGE